MKRIYILFMSMIVQLLYGMEKAAPTSCTKIENVCNLIPGIKLPIGIGFVKNNVITVLEKNSFIVCDIQTGKNIIQKTTESNICDFAINKPGNKVALAENGCLTVYDGVSGNQEWQKGIQSHLNVAFNSQDCTQLTSYDKFLDKLIIHCKDSESKIKAKNTILDAHVFAHHPHNAEILYGCTSQSFYQYNYISQGEPHYHDLQRYSNPTDYIMGQCYTVDGSYILIVMRAPKETIVYRLSAKEKDIKWMVWNSQYYSSILCHPNNRIFFLLDCKNKIECLNYNKSEHVHTIEIVHQEDIPSNSYMEKRLSVSHDGRKLFVALKDKCCMIELPLEAFYGSEVTAQIIFILLAWQYYNEKNSVDLIKDIRYSIINTLLALYNN
jgi:WD40 repeat protein